MKTKPSFGICVMVEQHQKHHVTFDKGDFIDNAMQAHNNQSPLSISANLNLSRDEKYFSHTGQEVRKSIKN